MDVLAELARESEHPRAFEVLSQTIKNIGDTTEKLMALQKQKKDLQKDEKEEARQVTNNNMFVGSTTDLQRMLLNKDNVIDAEAKE
jgi:ATP adenylyltransferase/5',5'''-P-1,P-4-tetraphosphate phosphorylase II